MDLRDPKLSTRPDGQLMLLAGGSVYGEKGFLTRRPRVSFPPDGRSWSALQPVLAEEHWLWRATWFQGTAYSVSKMGDGKDTRRVILYSSKDGSQWDWVTVFKNIPAWPNETGRKGMAKVSCHFWRNSLSTPPRSEGVGEFTQRAQILSGENVCAAFPAVSTDRVGSRNQRRQAIQIVGA